MLVVCRCNAVGSVCVRDSSVREKEKEGMMGGLGLLVAERNETVRMETPGAVEGVGRVIGYGRVRAELEHGAICPNLPYTHMGHLRGWFGPFCRIWGGSLCASGSSPYR